MTATAGVYAAGLGAGHVIAWRRETEPAAADLRGAVTDLLLVLYRRRPVTAVQVRATAELVDFWMERVPFG